VYKNAEGSLRIMTVGDLDKVRFWRNHPSVRMFMYNSNIITVEEHQQWFLRESCNSQKHLLLYEQQEGSLGFVNITKNFDGRIGEWGFYAAPGAPKGTGRRLGIAALEYAFEKIGITKMCANVLSYNERSVRYHLRMGFAQEGVLREQYFDGNRFHDIICFGLLLREWDKNI
jgi:UDP-4-amino-4,6-dideoxy-N-acetyl-beta-L-altrosamine N-acetyltransferase